MTAVIVLADYAWKYKAWADQTTAHPLAVFVLAVLAALVLSGRRGQVAIWFLALGMFVPQAQRLVVAGLDFDFMRILTLVALVRVALRRDWLGLRAEKQDALIIAFAISSLLGATLRSGGGEFINRLGFAFDAVGLYLVFRCVIRSIDDFVRMVRVAAGFALVVSILFVIERATGRNLFSAFGGVPETTVVRNGRLRCQGAFSHAILAGVFASVLACWFAGLCLSRRARVAGGIGLIASLVIVALTASSTPVSAIGLGIFAWLLFPLRRWFGLGILALCPILLALHFSMNNGIFHLFARIDFVGGSTGWHRYFLLDRSVAHFGEWWLFGTADTSHWGEGLFDITNQYLLEGVRGGLAPLILLCAVIVRAFSSATRAVRASGVGAECFIAYSLGVAMFLHALIFFSVSYFGQAVMLWYLTLAVVENSRLWWTANAARSSVVPGCDLGRSAVGPAVL